MVKYIQFKKEIKKVCISWLYIIVLVSNLFFVQPDFLKTAKIPVYGKIALSVQK